MSASWSSTQSTRIAPDFDAAGAVRSVVIDDGVERGIRP